jgi:antitoxin ParD1/3/4
MHVNLTPTLDEYVLAKVKSGRYNNASEVIRESVSRMQDEEAERATASEYSRSEIEQIRRDVQLAVEQIERGESKDYDGEEGLKQLIRDVRAQGMRQLAALRRKKAQR